MNGSSNGSAKPTKDKAGFDSEEMGMTQERQREIQASLFKMLGQADDDDKEPSEARSKTNSKRSEDNAAC